MGPVGGGFVTIIQHPHLVLVEEPGPLGLEGIQPQLLHQGVLPNVVNIYVNPIEGIALLLVTVFVVGFHPIGVLNILPDQFPDAFLGNAFRVLLVPDGGNGDKPILVRVAKVLGDDNIIIARRKTGYDGVGFLPCKVREAIVKGAYIGRLCVHLLYGAVLHCGDIGSWDARQKGIEKRG